VFDSWVKPMPRDEKYERLVFKQPQMKAPTNEYVCWLDVMGSRNIMRRSMSFAANFVMKLHIACLSTWESEPNIELYPMVDGVYACSTNLVELLAFVKIVYRRLAMEFVSEDNPLYRFMIRGGVSFGPVIKQPDFADCSEVLGENEDYCKRIFLGITLSQSYDKEREAPPFGIVMDDSVSAFGMLGSRPFAGVYWRWWSWDSKDGFDDRSLVKRLSESLIEYYDWCELHSYAIGYKPDRIASHRRLISEYFSEENEWPASKAQI
jgi:hypothetical protein